MRFLVEMHSSPANIRADCTVLGRDEPTASKGDTPKITPRNAPAAEISIFLHISGSRHHSDILEMFIEILLYFPCRHMDLTYQNKLQTGALPLSYPCRSKALINQWKCCQFLLSATQDPCIWLFLHKQNCVHQRIMILIISIIINIQFSSTSTFKEIIG